MPNDFFTLRAHIDGFMGCAGCGLFGSLQYDTMSCLCTCGSVNLLCVLFICVLYLMYIVDRVVLAHQRT